MNDVNQTILIGRLVAKPELKDVGKTVVAKFTVVTNRSFKTAQDSEWQQEATFVNCELFGAGAKVMAESMSKGNRIYVSGHLKTDQWKDKETGQSKSRMLLHVQPSSWINLESRPKKQEVSSGQKTEESMVGSSMSEGDIPF